MKSINYFSKNYSQDCYKTIIQNIKIYDKINIDKKKF